MKTVPQLLVIVGPTASGKSALAVRLARKFHGEVISADSRQVYRGLDIGSGKVTKKEMRGVPHHLIDSASPRRQFTAADFVRHARRALAAITRRGNLPIICGGTGFYIDALLGKRSLFPVPRDRALRQRLEGKSAEELFRLLAQCDPARATAVDPHNPRRLVRALEIASADRRLHPAGKNPVPAASTERQARADILTVGIRPDDRALRQKIRERLHQRIRRGLIAEVKNLHAHGLSWRRLDALGLEYRFVARFLRGELSRADFETVLEQKIWHYARRQKTWFKRNKDIVWFDPDDSAAIEHEVERWLFQT